MFALSMKFVPSGTVCLCLFSLSWSRNEMTSSARKSSTWTLKHSRTLACLDELVAASERAGGTSLVRYEGDCILLEPSQQQVSIRVLPLERSVGVCAVLHIVEVIEMP